jgi:hypothetical protein
MSTAAADAAAASAGRAAAQVSFVALTGTLITQNPWQSTIWCTLLNPCVMHAYRKKFLFHYIAL